MQILECQPFEFLASTGNRMTANLVGPEPFDGLVAGNSFRRGGDTGANTNPSKGFFVPAILVSHKGSLDAVTVHTLQNGTDTKSRAMFYRPVTTRSAISRLCESTSIEWQRAGTPSTRKCQQAGNQSQPMGWAEGWERSVTMSVISVLEAL